MGKILVSGLTNVETSVKVNSFPIGYCPIEYPFFGIDSCVSGVGFNIAKALKTLGDEVDLLSEIGNDINGELIVSELRKEGIEATHCLVFDDGKTAESVVFVDKEGKRKIYCDLKDIQDRKPLDESAINLEDYSVAILTNINFNRELLNVAKRKEIHIATDVHVLGDLNDQYNQDFMKNADTLFLSNEAIKGREADFLKEIYARFHNQTIVCGCGEEGALMYLGDEDRFIHEKAIAPKGIVSTVGAGDALFSAFIHFLNKGYPKSECLRLGVLFAGYKIASNGGSNGFVSEGELL